jgi:Domain of unknown function (DUF1877)
MPMSTTLFAVTDETLKALVAKPESIGKFESKATYDTYLWQSLPYFLAGGEDGEEADDEDDAEENDDEDEDEEPVAEEEDEDEEAHALSVVLTGDRAVKCRSLENGAFYTLVPSRVAELSALLTAVKSNEIKKLVLKTDLEEALDGELYEELEQLDLTEPDDVAKRILTDLKALVAFYASAAKQNLAIVSYTT